MIKLELYILSKVALVVSLCEPGSVVVSSVFDSTQGHRMDCDPVCCVHVLPA